MKKYKYKIVILIISLLCLSTFIVAFFYFLPQAQDERAQREKHVEEIRRLELTEIAAIKNWEKTNGTVFEASRSSLPVYKNIQAEINIIIDKKMIENDQKEKWNKALSQTTKYGSFSTITLITLVLLLLLLLRNKELKED